LNYPSSSIAKLFSPVALSTGYRLAVSLSVLLFVLLSPNKDLSMLSLAVTFFIIAIVAAVLGFGGIAGAAVGVAKITFVVALIIAVVAFISGRRTAG
jgi:uncharacterized membrane protein YtjA (UPF0391 family)